MFKDRLIKAGEEGLLLFTKYALIVVLAYFVLAFGTNVINGASNGTNAVLYLNELQNKGWLPKVQNGTVPAKEEQNAKTNP